MIEGFIEIEDDGSVRFSPDLVKKLGFLPGCAIGYETNEHTVLLHRPIQSLNRVYVEATNSCNLMCTTCIRNVWQEKTGFMKFQMFENLLDSLMAEPLKPEIFFGGFGEPLTHPAILDMVKLAKEKGFPTMMITNGTRLSDEVIDRLIQIPLDMLWVSVDSICEDSYESIRDGASFGSVLGNLGRFDSKRIALRTKLPELGIAYVAMKRTVEQLPDLVVYARKIHAKRVMVTNVLAHTEDLAMQRLYSRSLRESGWTDIDVILPRVDLKNQQMVQSLSGLARVLHTNLLEKQRSTTYDCCPFVLKGSVSVRWDGHVSPCLPLLHMSPSYLGSTKRINHAYSVGSLDEHSIVDIWNSKEYTALRNKLKSFEFAPCTMCFHEGCEIVQENQEDCFGNSAPACGGCQWAQGFIQCP